MLLISMISDTEYVICVWSNKNSVVSAATDSLSMPFSSWLTM